MKKVIIHRKIHTLLQDIKTEMTEDKLSKQKGIKEELQKGKGQISEEEEEEGEI